MVSSAKGAFENHCLGQHYANYQSQNWTSSSTELILPSISDVFHPVITEKQSHAVHLVSNQATNMHSRHHLVALPVPPDGSHAKDCTYSCLTEVSYLLDPSALPPSSTFSRSFNLEKVASSDILILHKFKRALRSHSFSCGNKKSSFFRTHSTRRITKMSTHRKNYGITSHLSKPPSEDKNRAATLRFNRAGSTPTDETITSRHLDDTATGALQSSRCIFKYNACSFYPALSTAFLMYLYRYC